MFNDTVMNVGNTAKERKNFDDPQEGRVYHPKGVAPTIRSCGVVATGNRKYCNARSAAEVTAADGCSGSRLATVGRRTR